MDPPSNDNDTVRIDDSVCEGDTTFENGMNESSWDFVDKSVSIDTSDDDSSIVIIEREVQRPDSTPPSNAESENEDTDSYTDVSDSSSDNEKTKTKESTAVTPLYTVQRLDTHVRPKLPVSLSYEWSLCKFVFLFVMLVQTTCFFVLMGTRLFGPSLYFGPDPLLTELRENMRSSKSIIDDVYAFQRDLLKHIYRVNDELYAANLFNLRNLVQPPYQSSSPFMTKEWDLILNVPFDDRPMCQEESIRESPSVCRGVGNTVVLLMTAEQLKSLFEDTSSFLRDIAHKYERVNDDIANFVLLKTNKKEQSNVFAQDCDNFSKNYRPDFCSKKDEAGELCNAQNSMEKSCSDTNGEKDELRPSQESLKVKRATKDLLDLMIKFKNDFDYLYKIYAENEDEMEDDVSIEVEEDEEEENEDDDDSNDSEEIEKNATPINETNEAIPETDVDAKSADVPNVEQVEESTPAEVSSEPTKVGEWLFDMHAAREQLRNYYEHAISGDWILRLGKQREKLRNSKSSKKESRKRKEEQWSTGWKAPEKFRRGLKKMASKWKSKFKKMTDNFVHTYEKYVPANWQLRWSF